MGVLIKPSTDNPHLSGKDVPQLRQIPNSSELNCQRERHPDSILWERRELN